MKSFNADTPMNAGFGGKPATHETIGDIIRRNKNLTELQVEQVLLYQRKHGILFGEAAVALSLATTADVMKALSVQFEYPHSSVETEVFPDELIAAKDPFSDQAEIFRDLRSQLLMGVFAPDRQRSALAVVSAGRKDGRSYTAANLAISLSQLGGNTLLVDADLRSPRLHTMFNIEPSSGLSGMLVGRATGDVIRSVESLPSLFVMPAGTVPPNPLELIQRPAFGLLVHELFTRFDHVIVDTPAAVNGADARVIASKCGASLVVARKAKTTMKPLRELVTNLKRGSSSVVGVLVNER